MEKQIAVIGLGVFGSEVALSLMKRNFTVLAIDENQEVIESIKEQVTQAMILDTTQEQALLEAGIQEMDTVVVAIGTGHLENSILTTALLRQIGVKHIIARAANKLHERILRQVGAHEIVNPEREMGVKIANKIAQPGFLEMFSLTDDVCVVELPVPESFVGHTLEELNVRKRFNINVLGVQRLRSDELTAPTTGAHQGGRSKTAKKDVKGAVVETELEDRKGARRMIMNISPANDRFQKDDILLAMGYQDDVNRLLAQK
ncbi:MAG: TrkA family potassium uptake protein [Lentisphaerae bacterium]|jgi:trk system potassium uptake protein TrkA|nr:TrkA family potassium uptake protein [Lentisphaerota bacterium]